MLEFFLSYFLIYQYWLLFLVMYITSVGFPTPATALLIAGGAFYAQGYFDLSNLFLSGTLGCILGDLTGYGLSYIYGKRIFYRIGLRKLLDSRQFTDFEPVFIRHNLLSVFITRCIVTGLGPTVNILAGLTKMHPIKFIIVDIIGENIYIALGIIIGYTFGSEWESILNILESFSTIILSLFLIGIILFFYHRHQQKSNPQE